MDNIDFKFLAELIKQVSKANGEAETKFFIPEIQADTIEDLTDAIWVSGFQTFRMNEQGIKCYDAWILISNELYELLDTNDALWDEVEKKVPPCFLQRMGIVRADKKICFVNIKNRLNEKKHIDMAREIFTKNNLL